MTNACVTYTVTDDDTAAAVGSGSLPVLGTPRLLAWCEAATCAVPLDIAGTTVGTRIKLDHLLASPVGATIEIRARLSDREGRRLQFAVTATDQDGRLVGTAVIMRAVVDPEGFMAKLSR